MRASYDTRPPFPTKNRGAPSRDQATVGRHLAVAEYLAGRHDQAMAYANEGMEIYTALGCCIKGEAFRSVGCEGSCAMQAELLAMLGPGGVARKAEAGEDWPLARADEFVRFVSILMI